MLEDVKTLYASAQCPYITFKGAILREYYPVPESRAMGDIDVLIKAEDRDKIKNCLYLTVLTVLRKTGGL